jgi:SAM-dependent methyltransferase
LIHYDSRAMDWRIKGTIQKVLGYLPGGDDLHYQLQRRAGGLRFLDKEIRIKIEDWRLMAGHLKNAGIPIKGTRFVEMGTGWYPTFPFLLYLGGAGRVDTIDLNRYVRYDLTVECARKIGEGLDVIAQAVDRKLEDVRAAHAELTRCLARGDDITDATGGVVRYRAPADASDTKLPAESVDVVFSNSVLEHVPGDVIAACLTEAKRILAPRGIVFHSVNCGDHYAYADERISQLNYLQFGNDTWKLWNNRFLYQNRLRAIDFTDMARAAGFTIELDTSRPHPKRLAELARIEVHPDFARYSRDQLAITSIDFIGRK